LDHLAQAKEAKGWRRWLAFVAESREADGANALNDLHVQLKLAATGMLSSALRRLHQRSQYSAWRKWREHFLAHCHSAERAILQRKQDQYSETHAQKDAEMDRLREELQCRISFGQSQAVQAAEALRYRQIVVSLAGLASRRRRLSLRWVGWRMHVLSLRLREEHAAELEISNRSLARRNELAVSGALRVQREAEASERAYRAQIFELTGRVERLATDLEKARAMVTKLGLRPPVVVGAPAVEVASGVGVQVAARSLVRLCNRHTANRRSACWHRWRAFVIVGSIGSGGSGGRVVVNGVRGKHGSESVNSVSTGIVWLLDRVESSVWVLLQQLLTSASTGNSRNGIGTPMQKRAAVAAAKASRQQQLLFSHQQEQQGQQEQLLQACRQHVLLQLANTMDAIGAWRRSLGGSPNHSSSGANGRPYLLA
jgi:hypothetical protein